VITIPGPTIAPDPAAHTKPMINGSGRPRSPRHRPGIAPYTLIECALLGVMIGVPEIATPCRGRSRRAWQPGEKFADLVEAAG
jgi:hypothetical protein